ncbi:putative U2 small nuclear RNA auxillary factor [Encephalitozoon intestinalis ATCC 50506]|uniref:U2 small nuclear RNA auxillary factor n=1 Tax=Encephalitozoon intestinalis (strain ATCC 50506) TaxID=876142 RepID=E0S8Z0_ENCIT|nr:putative U2 small nuclear RNA auxillary factor [Encephalitozoon intestinalis ATCC 50506]ADM12256.1 putative U2 small nuclear RNA auxillary factor [Encephalitozoon intestinalis ATCC 50506]UTX46063.1 splicing factor U2AF 23 [Encephalitozoon intestinalis]
MATGRDTCLFYSKTNACRYGLECTKAHRIPIRGKVVVVKGMYLYPKNDPESTLSKESIQIHLDLFYEDWFSELSIRYGSIRRLVIASNSSSQLLGNIYIEFEEEKTALRCVEEIGKRYYSGRRIAAELGNCYRIDDGMCTDNEKEKCEKGEKCGFIHSARVSTDLAEELFESQGLLYGEKGTKSTWFDGGAKASGENLRKGPIRNGNPHESYGMSRRRLDGQGNHNHSKRTKGRRDEEYPRVRRW